MAERKRERKREKKKGIKRWNKWKEETNEQRKK
jgi:hypothetical protein